ncbi:19194_t:CDS:1 [Gigaspora rosea]|nr:19194_t:CDS:1 [Gigaspora rosea]
MATPKPYNEEAPLSTENKGKRKAQYCDLEGQDDDVVCNYEKFGTNLVSDRVTIPSSSQHLNLVGKELCRNHYNRLIVNPKNQLANTCSHPKHNLYRSTARKNKEGN